ncbi:hypothetical protein [Spiroplasma monobiae]|uniref:Transmembrane protein n=1 Tax=Spiroplasma monobiae MQ-1 TaxID=1336748 RepID=A0A2K9LUH6_SPISQ|nr:hypothetical protein [Spiroplasma monobiae]AUM62702.1 hypothetical protein SMONO_v1c04530 [Spiroplasma monobiae MQ-1]
MSKQKQKQNSIDLLKKHNKIIGKFFKTNYIMLFWFLFEQILFGISFILFVLNLFIKDVEWISYSIISICLFLLLKFTYTNWFAKNKFFRCIDVFEYDVKLESHKFKAKRAMEFTPIWFWIYIIGANFITVIFINYELKGFLEEHKILEAISMSMLNVLLVPSFLNSFQKLTEKNDGVDSNYLNVIKNQYFSNESLFEEAKFSEHCLNAVFSKNDLTSKNGIFVFTNKKDLNQKEVEKLQKLNENILEDYKKIWANYYDLLESSSSLEFSKRKVKNLFWLERIYDHIFLDFFNI